MRKINQRHSGFSLIELQMGLIIASILILAAGAMASISQGSYKNLTTESQVYNDVIHSFKMIQNRFHASSDFQVEAQVEPWQSQKLLINHQTGPQEAFGIYQKPGSKIRELVHQPDTSIPDKKEVLLTINGDELNLILSPDVNKDSIALQLVGVKDKIPFDVETTVKKRAD